MERFRPHLLLQSRFRRRSRPLQTRLDHRQAFHHKSSRLTPAPEIRSDLSHNHAGTKQRPRRSHLRPPSHHRRPPLDRTSLLELNLPLNTQKRTPPIENSQSRRFSNPPRPTCPLALIRERNILPLRMSPTYEIAHRHFTPNQSGASRACTFNFVCCATPGRTET